MTLAQIAFRRDIVRRSAIVALVVGSILNLINQGDALLGAGPVDPLTLVLTCIVPYCVAPYGAVTAIAQSERVKKSMSSAKHSTDSD